MASYFCLFSIAIFRSVVYQQSSKESATLQLFFTLQLDIQSDKIRTVQDALESLVARESVQGYTTKAWLAKKIPGKKVQMLKSGVLIPPPKRIF